MQPTSRCSATPRASSRDAAAAAVGQARNLALHGRSSICVWELQKQRLLGHQETAQAIPQVHEARPWPAALTDSSLLARPAMPPLRTEASTSCMGPSLRALMALMSGDA